MRTTNLMNVVQNLLMNWCRTQNKTKAMEGKSKAGTWAYPNTAVLRSNQSLLVLGCGNK
jgi:hypothetical protein